MFSKFLYKTRWGIWSLIQSKNSNIDFDFLGYAILRLDFYKRRRQLASIRGHLSNSLLTQLYGKWHDFIKQHIHKTNYENKIHLGNWLRIILINVLWAAALWTWPVLKQYLAFLIIQQPEIWRCNKHCSNKNCNCKLRIPQLMGSVVLIWQHRVFM